MALNGKSADYWNRRASNTAISDPLLEVQRSRGGVPISRSELDELIGYVTTVMNLSSDDQLLELFCGNGAFTLPFSKICESVVGVDFSEGLVQQIRAMNLDNVDTVISNVTDLPFQSRTFSAVLAYAGLQYLSEAEATSLVFSLQSMVRAEGKVFLGDIPDSSRRWAFIRGRERRREHFEYVRRRTDTIGTWYTQDFFLHLFDAYGFRAEILGQPETQLNSSHRFDVFATRIG